MGHPSMATCILVALVLPRLIYTRPATDNSGSVLSMLESRVSKPEDLSDYEQKVISSLVQGNLSVLAKSRQRRLSDQRRAELETLMSLSKINGEHLLTREHRLDLARIGRRRRFIVDQIPTELVSIKAKHIGDPAYPLIS